MIKINFEILGKEWVMKVLKRKKYRQRNGKDSVAITYCWKRRIDVGIAVVLEDIVHELMHAYMSEMCIKTTDEMTAADMEEFFAELLSKRGRELLDLADNLMEQVTKIAEPKITFVQKTD